LLQASGERQGGRGRRELEGREELVVECVGSYRSCVYFINLFDLEDYSFAVSPHCSPATA
jgi:hypothetical protein